MSLKPVTLQSLAYLNATGKTPAINLAENYPPSRPITILSLGCGDIRDILFTAYAGRGPCSVPPSFTMTPAYKAHIANRMIDITTCDIEAEILARNIVAYTMILDDGDNSHITEIFNIFYHVVIDSTCMSILQNQVKKLLDCAQSPQAWQNGPYGRLIRFCDSVTFCKVVRLWRLYAIDSSDPNEFAAQQKFLEEQWRAAQHHRNIKVDKGEIKYGLRSYAPAMHNSLDELVRQHEYFWTKGSTFESSNPLKQLTLFNPMFVCLRGGMILHPETNPLRGFHLLMADDQVAMSPLNYFVSNPEDNMSNAVKTAVGQFSAWSQSFRDAAASITIRCITCEAMAFSHVLEYHGVHGESASAHWYRSSQEYRQLHLDLEDYLIPIAPTLFDVIDASNLIERLGSLNLLAAVSPLLRKSPTSTLRTEMQISRCEDIENLVDTILCGHLPSVSALLGIMPIQYWTSSTATFNVDHSYFGTMADSPEVHHLREQQVVLWKPVSTRLSSSKPVDLACFLYKMYLAMFNDDGVTQRGTQLSLSNGQSFHPFNFGVYSGGGFCAVMYTLIRLGNLDFCRYTNMLMSMVYEDAKEDKDCHFIRSFKAHLYMWGYYYRPEGLQVEPDKDPIEGSSQESPTTSPIPESGPSQEIPAQNSTETLPQELPDQTPMEGVLQINPVKEPRKGPLDELLVEDPTEGPLLGNKNLPAIVCVTLVVPREVLNTFQDLLQGTHVCLLALQSAHESSENTFHRYSDVQIGFGCVQSFRRANNNAVEVAVFEDEQGWAGNSPLIVSAMVLTNSIVHDGDSKCGVHLQLQSTPGTPHFLNDHGKPLDVHVSAFGQPNVLISACMPNMGGYQQMSLIKPIPVPSFDWGKPEVEIRFTTGSQRIEMLRVRIEVTTPCVTDALMVGFPVEFDLRDPTHLAIEIGPNVALGIIELPIPCHGGFGRGKVARSQSWIEYTAPVATLDCIVRRPDQMFLVSRDSAGVFLGHLPYINPVKAPVYDFATPLPSVTWPATLTSFNISWSPSERRDYNTTYDDDRKFASNGRLAFRKTLWSIFMRFNGLQGYNKNHRFAIVCNATRTLHLLILVSSVRMDLSNQSFFLDVAVVPVTRSTARSLDIDRSQWTPLPVEIKELLVWQNVIPAFVERCRLSNHRPGCQYATDFRGPLVLDYDKDFMCDCGFGDFSKGYLANDEDFIPLKHRAARGGIPVCYGSPFDPSAMGSWLENVITEGRFEDSDTVEPECWFCKLKEPHKDFQLFRCTGCDITYYCSPACQVSDWLRHRNDCGLDPHGCMLTHIPSLEAFGSDRNSEVSDETSGSAA